MRSSGDVVSAVRVRVDDSYGNAHESTVCVFCISKPN